MSSQCPVVNIKRLLFYGVAFLIVFTIIDVDIVFSQDYESGFDEAISPSESEVTRWSSSIGELGLTGSLRGGYWSSNRLNNSEKNVVGSSVWLTLDKRLKKGLTIYTEAYGYNEDVLGEGSSRGQLKEAYFHFRSGDWDFRLGRQIVAWGRADRLNPTDNLTPRDFTLLSPEVDEERLGTEGIKISKIFGFYSSLTAIWLTSFEPNKLPPANAPGLQLIENVPKNNDQYAIKFDQSGGDVDWSISYFKGLDLNSDLSVIGLNSNNVLVAQTYHDVEIFGADVATIKGSNRYAVEVAYTKTEDSSGDNPNIKNNFFYGVFGIDRDFGDNLSLITQFFYRRVSDYQDPRQIIDPSIRTVASLSATASNQLDRDEYGLNMRLGKNWLNETLELEISGATQLIRHGYLIRPKLAYKINDHLKVSTGLEYFRGGPDTIFGLQEANKLFFLEMRQFF